LSLGSTLQTGSFEQSQIGSITGSILCFYFALSAVALVKALRRRNLLDIFAIGQILLIFCLDWRTLLYPHEMIRVPAVALMLIFFVIVSPSVKEPNEMERDG
jgi:prepilin signal peptidase PulO-like enzyme (type II secretory pathway)